MIGGLCEDAIEITSVRRSLERMEPVGLFGVLWMVD